MERIEAKERPLSDLFSESFIFTVPVYQRPFSWTLDQFDELFEDIVNAIQNRDEQYFLGSILLQQTGKYRYAIVDGQQRITAITLLLACIRDVTKNDGLRKSIDKYLYQEEDEFKEIPAVMRLTPWEELRDLFKKYIYTKDGTSKYLDDFGKQIDYKDNEDPRYHIYESILTFHSKAADYEDIEDFVKFLLNRVYVVTILTKSRTSAFRLFNVMNSRGLPLDASDLLKSENLEAIADDSKRNRYSEIWRGIEEELGRKELNDIIAFIRMIKIKEKAEYGIYDEYQRMFRENLLSKGISFIEYLKEISDIYRDKIYEPELNSKDPSDKNDYEVTIKMMNDFLPFIDWIPPLLAFYQKFRSDLMLLRFLRKLEKKVILEWTIGYSGTERITSLSKLIKLIDESSSANDVLEKFEPPKKDEFAQFRIKLNDSKLYTIYQSKLVKYLLLRIDKEYHEIENFKGYVGAVTVEHILPQNPNIESEWNRVFNEKQREEKTNKLGNLLLLSGRKNAKAQNHEFNHKKQVYGGPKATSFEITRKIEKFSKWTPIELEERHLELVKLATEIFSN